MKRTITLSAPYTKQEACELDLQLKKHYDQIHGLFFRVRCTFWFIGFVFACLSHWLPISSDTVVSIAVVGVILSLIVYVYLDLKLLSTGKTAYCDLNDYKATLQKIEEINDKELAGFLLAIMQQDRPFTFDEKQLLQEALHTRKAIIDKAELIARTEKIIHINSKMAV